MPAGGHVPGPRALTLFFSSLLSLCIRENIVLKVAAGRNSRPVSWGPRELGRVSVTLLTSHANVAQLLNFPEPPVSHL